MIKSWLVTSCSPFCGTERNYAAYAEDEDKLIDWLYTNWFDEECQNLYDSFGYMWENNHEEEEFNDEEYDALMDEWNQDCSLKVEECDEEDFSRYVPGGKGKLEIIYDERK